MTTRIFRNSSQKDELRRFVKFLLSKTSIKPELIEYCVRPDHMEVFDKAFTAPSANPTHNYETLEFIGDGKLGSFMTDYVYEVNPHLHEDKYIPVAKEILSKTKAKYVSKTVLNEMASSLGMKKFILASSEDMGNKQKSILEDVFEAFLGAVTVVIEKEHRRQGLSQFIINQFLYYSYTHHLKAGFDADYESVTSPISIIKEYYDKKKDFQREYVITWSGFSLRTDKGLEMFEEKDPRITNIEKNFFVNINGVTKMVYPWKIGELREYRSQKYEGFRDLNKPSKEDKIVIQGKRHGRDLTVEFDEASIKFCKDEYRVLGKGTGHRLDQVKERSSEDAITKMRQEGIDIKSRFEKKMEQSS